LICSHLNQQDKHFVENRESRSARKFIFQRVVDLQARVLPLDQFRWSLLLVKPIV
jgi:hypothetical protein